MSTQKRLGELGLFDRRVPRYTSYPTAPVFSTDCGEAFMRSCLQRLDPDAPVSVYLHIPFCERLCWFCACRTQGVKSQTPVERYLAVLLQEIERVRALCPSGLKMGRLHWGGGTPTILTPELIETLATAVKAAFEPAETFEFSVEIDPTAVNADKIDALTAMGMNRASIGIQDFADEVQTAIGRPQSLETTQNCIDMLRAAGISSLNADLVYGLPHQTLATINETVDHLIGLDPDRIALFGYAHVPWMAKRQRMIDEEVLPGDRDRNALFKTVTEKLQAHGYDAIGIDHFAKAEDTLAVAARTGQLRRNFQGYTTDTCRTLIGMGASAISAFEQGYMQNISATGAYSGLIQKGQLAAHRGHSHTLEDRLRARAIEMLMCDFRIDLDELQDSFGSAASLLKETCRTATEQFAPFVVKDGNGIAITHEGRPLTRIIAHMFDAYPTPEAKFSRAS